MISTISDAHSSQMLRSPGNASRATSSLAGLPQNVQRRSPWLASSVIPPPFSCVPNKLHAVVLDPDRVHVRRLAANIADLQVDEVAFDADDRKRAVQAICEESTRPQTVIGRILWQSVRNP